MALWPLFKGKSVNTPAFLLAVLKHEKVVVPVKGKQRIHQLADLPGFKARLTVAKPAAKKKASRRKAG